MTSFAYQNWAIICHSSPHLFTSQAQFGWGQMHIFRFLQKYLITFKPRLWLGHSRIFTELFISHSCCVLIGSLSCWKVNLLPSLRFWMLWIGYSLRLSQYFGALSFSSTLTSPSVPSAEKQPHSMRLLPAHFTFGMVLCSWWAELVSFKHDVWNWGLSDQRISFLRVWGSFRCFFLQIPSVFSCVFTEERIASGHTSIKPRLVELLQWCLSFCRFLLSPHMIMEFN